MVRLCIVAVAGFLVIGCSRSGSSDPPHKVVGMSSETISSAVGHSRATFDHFVMAYSRRERAQEDFVVVFLDEQADSYVPVGILVEKVDDDTVWGRRIENALLCKPGERVGCHRSKIVDWRYVDTLEMCGGALYLRLYELQQRRVQLTIRDAQPFLIRREERIDEDALRLFRDVANGRCDRLEQLPQTTLNQVTAEMPVTTYSIGRRIALEPVSIPQYAAMYGNKNVVDVLFAKGVLDEIEGEVSPLVDSSYAGNLETTQRLVELGYDVNCTDESGDAPLHQAVKWNHVHVVRYLIQQGANCNARDIRQKTPLFYVTTLDVAEALIAAGADVHAVSDIGESVVTGHLMHRRMDIVRLLIQAGVQIDEDASEAGSAVDGEHVLLEALHASGDSAALSEYKTATSVDFGCVLPVRSLPKER